MKIVTSVPLTKQPFTLKRFKEFYCEACKSKFFAVEGHKNCTHCNSTNVGLLPCAGQCRNCLSDEETWTITTIGSLCDKCIKTLEAQHDMDNVPSLTRRYDFHFRAKDLSQCPSCRSDGTCEEKIRDTMVKTCDSDNCCLLCVYHDTNPFGYTCARTCMRSYY